MVFPLTYTLAFVKPPDDVPFDIIIALFVAGEIVLNPDPVNP